MVRDFNPTSRRSFMSALGAIGVSPGAIEYLTPDNIEEVTADPSDQVPRLDRVEGADSPRNDEPGDDRKPIFYAIPRDTWEYRAACREAAERLSERFDDEWIRAEVTTDVRGQRRQRVVRVVRIERRRRRPGVGGDDGEATVAAPDTSLEELRGQVPAEMSVTVGEGAHETRVEGIPVIVDERTTVEESHDDGEGYYDYWYDQIPAGAQYSLPDGEHCTICCPVVDDETGEDLLLTAGHCVVQTEAERVYQPFLCRDDGEVTDVGFPQRVMNSAEGDAATIDVSQTGRRTDPYFALDDGTVEDGRYEGIQGIVGYDKLEDELKDESYEVYQQGRTSGRSKGYISALSSSSTLGSIELTGVEHGIGDSGGPYWWQSPYGHDYMVGVHNAGHPSDPVVEGCVMELVEREFGVSVLTV